MKITNLEQTTKILKHLAGRKEGLEAVVKKVEGKAIQFSSDNIVTVETQFDSNKNRIKAGDKIAVNVATGEIELLERAPKENSLISKAIDAVTPAKESSTRGCSSAKAFAREKM